jgi:transcriptional regulator with XRE-family HTH domain
VTRPGVKRAYAPRRDGDPDAAEVIRSRRRQLGLSIERAARLAGCSTGMWSQLENAKRRPSVVMAELIADALELSGQARDMVLAAGLEGVGRASPYRSALRRRGTSHPW